MAKTPLPYRHLGGNLARLRQERGITQGTVAEILDVSLRMVQQVESGQKAFSLPRLARLAAFLKVTFDALLAGMVEAEKGVPELARRTSTLVGKRKPRSSIRP